MGVKLKKADLTKGHRIYVDAKTGTRAPVKDPNPLLIWFSLWRYEQIIKGKFGFLEKTGIQLPTVVPEDLVLPFEAFLQKYNLGRSYKPITHYLQGQGTVRNLLALYALKNLSAEVTRCARTNSFVTAASGVDTLYDKIRATLGDTLRCNVHVQSVRRNPDWIEITVMQDGQPLKIHCSKLFVTFPPVLANMESFDLDQQETTVFEKFKPFYYWTVMVKISGLPSDTVFFPIDGNDPLTGQIIPGIYTIVPTPMPNTYNILYGSEHPLIEYEILEDLTGFVKRMSKKLNGQEIKLDSWTRMSHVRFGSTLLNFYRLYLDKAHEAGISLMGSKLHFIQDCRAQQLHL